MESRMILKVIIALFLLPISSLAYDIEADYEYVAADQDLQICGPVGRVGDILERLILIPESLSPGRVFISDDISTDIFTGGDNSVSDLTPIVINLGMRAKGSAGWTVLTGGNVHAICIGKFK